MSYYSFPDSIVEYFVRKIRLWFIERTQIASNFDTSVSYNTGDYCLYNNKLYRFATDHHGPWITSDAVETTIMDEMKNKSNGVILPINPSDSYKTISGAMWLEE